MWNNTAWSIVNHVLLFFSNNYDQILGPKYDIPKVGMPIPKLT